MSDPVALLAERLANGGRAEAEKFAGLLMALADTSRLRILSLIHSSSHPVRAGDLEKDMRLSQPTIAHHLRVLRAAGVIVRGKDDRGGHRRMLSIDDAVLQVICDDLRSLAPRTRRRRASPEGRRRP